MATRTTKTATRARGTAKQARPASGAAKKYGGTTARATTTSGDGDETRGRNRPLQYCSLQPRPTPVLPPEVAAMPGRARAILRGRDKWANRTVIHYAFIGGSHQYAIPKAQADVVRAAIRQWKGLGIGLEFAEVNDLDEAEVRIGFLDGDGSWSYVGKDVLGIPADQPTMSFGWSLNEDPYGMTTALHEVGHTLGLPHEHQNPFAGIVWNEQAVYASLGGPPNNWDQQTTFHNILKKLSTTEVTGSTWDPDSIMEYEFGPGLIIEPAKYNNGIFPPGTLSPLDKEWVQKWYPGAAPAERKLEPFRSVELSLEAGEQADFVLTPPSTRAYTVGTYGASDTVLTLFEDVNGEPRFLAGDDDSGTDRNASIRYRLRVGRKYYARLRLYWPGASGRSALMYW